MGTSKRLFATYKFPICIYCGMVIEKSNHFVKAHYPIGRSQGGTNTEPAHKWCDAAAGLEVQLTSEMLSRMIDRWRASGYWKRCKFRREAILTYNVLRNKERSKK